MATRQETIEKTKAAMLAALESENYADAFKHADYLRGVLGQGASVGQCDGSLTFNASEAQALLGALHALYTIVE